MSKRPQPETFLIPYPPSVNKSTTVCRGRKIKSAHARKWEKITLEELELQRPRRIAPPYRITITLYPDSKRRFDPDNRIKSVLDVMVKSGILEDDNSGCAPDTRVRMGVLAPSAFCLVTIEAIEYQAEPIPEDLINGIPSFGI